MKNKEITIYDNYYSLDREKEIREFLLETSDSYSSTDEIPDEHVWDEMDFQDREQWSDVTAERSTLFAKDVYLLTETCGKWYGPVQGGRFIRSIHDFLTCLGHLECVRIYDRNGHFYIHGSHHDDSDDYELKRLTNKGYELADKNQFAKDRELHNAIMHCNFYSALPRYAQKVYGL